MAETRDVVEHSDDLLSKRDFHDDPIEQLAFELAFELEDAELSPNDLVTVNREKLKAISRRVIERLRSQGGVPEGWRDIKSCPKDGSEFLAWPCEIDGHLMAVPARWYVHHSVQGPITDVIDCGDFEFEPTLWMPKPDAVLLSAAPQPPLSAGEAGWRDISSAPKDGTEVLLRTPTRRCVSRWFVLFDEQYWFGVGPPSRNPEEQPTHWMPLPPSPDDRTNIDVAQSGSLNQTLPESSPLPNVDGLREALTDSLHALQALLNAVKTHPAMQDRRFIPVGIQVNNAIDKARAALASTPAPVGTEHLPADWLPQQGSIEHLIVLAMSDGEYLGRHSTVMEPKEWRETKHRTLSLRVGQASKVRQSALDAAGAAEREKVHYLQAVVRNALQWHEDHRVALQKVGPGTIPQWVTDGWAVLAAIRSGKAAAE